MAMAMSSAQVVHLVSNVNQRGGVHIDGDKRGLVEHYGGECRRQRGKRECHVVFGEEEHEGNGVQREMRSWGWATKPLKMSMTASVKKQLGGEGTVKKLN